MYTCLNNESLLGLTIVTKFVALFSKIWNCLFHYCASEKVANFVIRRHARILYLPALQNCSSFFKSALKCFRYVLFTHISNNGLHTQSLSVKLATGNTSLRLIVLWKGMKNSSALCNTIKLLNHHSIQKIIFNAPHVKAENQICQNQWEKPSICVITISSW